MTLSKNDHIYVGMGDLYAPPFVGRVLLYRLFECNCALLIYHPVGGGVSDVSDFGPMQQWQLIADTSRLNLQSISVLTSASMDIKDLLALPATQARIAGNVMGPRLAALETSPYESKDLHCHLQRN